MILSFIWGFQDLAPPPAAYRVGGVACRDPRGYPPSIFTARVSCGPSLESAIRHVGFYSYPRTTCQELWATRGIRNLALFDRLGGIGFVAKSP